MSGQELGLVIVTGAGSGIGRAIAIRLMRSGYTCILVGRRLKPLEETKHLIAREGRDSYTVAADITSDEGRQRSLQAAHRLGARRLMFRHTG